MTTSSGLVLEASWLSTPLIAKLDALVSIRMWHSGSKCQKIGALVKASRKRLNVSLAPGVRKLGPAFLASKLGEFPLFDSFLDLADFLPSKLPDLDDFWLSDLPVFGSTCFDPSLNPLPSPPTLPNSLAASTLAPSTPLAARTYDDMVVFSIDMSGAAILLKPLMN